MPDSNPTNRLTEPAAGMLRVLFWLGTVAGCLCVLGRLAGPRIGGLGPTLFWLGLIVAAIAFLLVAVLKKLGQRRMDALRPLFLACVTSAQVGALALLMFEIDSWVETPMKPKIWTNKNPLDWLLRPHRLLGWEPARSYQLTADFKRGPVEIKINALGFRDIEQELDRDRPRVVIIGDSFAIGWGDRYEDSITPRLRAALPEAQVFNAGWGGYAKDQVALSYAVRAKPLDPSVVVAMFMVEPGVDDSKPLYSGLRKPWFVIDEGKLALRGLPLEFVTTEESNRALYRMWEAERITGPGTAWSFLTKEFPREHLAMGYRLCPNFDWQEIHKHGMPPPNAVEAAILVDLHAQVRADGARLLVVIAPHMHIYANCKDPAATMATYADHCRDLGLEILDVTPLLATDWRANHNPDAHPNAKGADRIRTPLAARIRTILRERGESTK